MSDLLKLRQSANSAFLALAQKAGLDPENYQLGREWIKDDPVRLHVVQRYDAPQLASVVLKHALLPADVPAFEAILASHQLAERALADTPYTSVPSVLAYDSSLQAYLMSHFDGRTFLDLCRESDDHSSYLTAIGSWLSAYHAATFQQERPFQPKFMLGHMNHLVGQMEKGEHKIKSQTQFIKKVGSLAKFAHQAEGYVGKVAAKHGDLNAHNLLIGNGQVVALDFLDGGNAPVGYDIARILLSYVQMVGDLDAIPKGQVLATAVLTAFFKGYTFVDQSDPTVDFLMRIQILTDWNRMKHKSTLGSLVRFKRLKEIARRAFA